MVVFNLMSSWRTIPVWLIQAQMAVFFDKDQSVVARHIQNAFKEEVDKESNMQILHNTLSKLSLNRRFCTNCIVA